MDNSDSQYYICPRGVFDQDSPIQLLLKKFSVRSIFKAKAGAKLELMRAKKYIDNGRYPNIYGCEFMHGGSVLKVKYDDNHQEKECLLFICKVLGGK